ncbi:hypothetical protein [Lacrimispora sp.]|uniref:hypothetical protein n=1 Tax=Lacrimispora sp. TaxID=2719234 RepID=UPI0028AA0FC9|nr:hypothetical protein [Lacrimispora sp.]
MKTKLTNSIVKGHAGYGTGPGIIEHFEYECPCGKGKILEEHNFIPDFEEHVVNIHCSDCCDKYELNTDLGIRSWNISKKGYILG